MSAAEWHRRYRRASDILLERMWRLPLVGARLASAERAVVPSAPCRVLFLCKGNICRSAFAEAVARTLVDGRRHWEFRSAGLEAGEGSPSPEAAVRVAREFGVDLESHRSRAVQSGDFSASDVVFVMEPGQKSQALERARSVHPGIALLGAFCGNGAHRPVIGDPFGHDDAAYRLAFARIVDAVGTILTRAGEKTRGS